MNAASTISNELASRTRWLGRDLPSTLPLRPPRLPLPGNFPSRPPRQLPRIPMTATFRPAAQHRPCSPGGFLPNCIK